MFRVHAGSLPASGSRRIGHDDITVLQLFPEQVHLVLDGANIGLSGKSPQDHNSGTDKLIDPKWIGINGALATKSPSGAKSAHE